MLKDIIKYIKQNLAPILTTVICVFALYLRLLKLYRHELWLDEMWQLNQMTGTFSDFLKQLPVKEVGSYLSGDYYLIYPFFKAFSFNKWGLAIPHIILTILGFYLLYLICKRYFKTFWGYMVVFAIVCFNSTLINHATEIRVYAVLPTLALASLYLAQLLIDSNFQLSTVKKIGIGLFFIILILFHIYGILIYSCTLISALLNRKSATSIRSLIKNLFKFMSIVLIIAIPVLIYCSFIGPHLEASAYKCSVTDFIPGPFLNPVGFLKGVLGNLLGFKILYFLLLSIVFPFILPFKDRLRLILFFATLILMPLVLIYILDTIVVYFFIPRQFIWIIPFFALYLGWSWDCFFVFLKRNSIKGGSSNE